MRHDNRYCTFRLDDMLFGIEVERVQEVLRYQTVTRVPLASPVVRGLINLRGEIVTAIDLRRRLQIEDGTSEEPPMNVVVHAEDGEAVSLLVDEIGDVVEVREESFEPPPATMATTLRSFVRGVHKLDGRLLLILDTDKAARPAKRTAHS